MSENKEELNEVDKKWLQVACDRIQKKIDKTAIRFASDLLCSQYTQSETHAEPAEQIAKLAYELAIAMDREASSQLAPYIGDRRDETGELLLKVRRNSSSLSSRVVR